MWLFFIFVAIPILEIALFIQVGGAIGLWPTLAVVVLTAMAGTALMRSQGLSTLNRLQNSLAEGRNPADPMAQGAMILVAGVLLLTPGFFTDAVGFALLLPPVRVFLIKWVSARVLSSGFVHTTTQSQQTRPKPNTDTTIDGNYSVLDEDENRPNDNPSGWTQR